MPEATVFLSSVFMGLAWCPYPQYLSLSQTISDYHRISDQYFYFFYMSERDH